MELLATARFSGMLIRRPMQPGAMPGAQFSPAREQNQIQKRRVRTPMSEQLLSAFADFKNSIEAKLGKLDTESKARYAELEKELLRPGYTSSGRRGRAEKSVGQLVVESDGFREWQRNGFAGGRRRLIIDLPERPALEVKALLSTGLTPTLRPSDEIDQLPRQSLRLRSLLDIREMTGGKIDYLQQTAVTSGASPQAEGAAKGESTIEYQAETATATTIAHHVTVSRQALDDIEGLRVDIDDTLLFELLLREEAQILAGNGVGVSLNGIITQATAYDTGLNVANDTPIDKIRHAILQCELAKGQADGIVLHPADLHNIELVKDGDVANFGRYIVGDPKTGSAMSVPFLWRRPVVTSLAIAEGQFLVGDFRRGATLFERRAASVEISFEHGNNFTMNLATILCEERIALAVRRPAVFVEGSFA
jgi:HK97 family phage major capsid protein